MCMCVLGACAWYLVHINIFKVYLMKWALAKRDKIGATVDAAANRKLETSFNSHTLPCYLVFDL